MCGDIGEYCDQISSYCFNGRCYRYTDAGGLGDQCEVDAECIAAAGPHVDLSTLECNFGDRPVRDCIWPYSPINGEGKTASATTSMVSLLCYRDWSLQF